MGSDFLNTPDSANTPPATITNAAATEPHLIQMPLFLFVIFFVGSFYQVIINFNNGISYFIAFHIKYPSFFKYSESLSLVRFSIITVLLLPNPNRSQILSIESPYQYLRIKTFLSVSRKERKNVDIFLESSEVSTDASTVLSPTISSISSRDTAVLSASRFFALSLFNRFIAILLVSFPRYVFKFSGL